MNTLDRQLRDLISLQDDVTHLNETQADVDAIRAKIQQRDNLRCEIVRIYAPKEQQHERL